MKWILVVVIASFMFIDTPEVVAQEVSLQEWEVPWAASRPRDPYVGPDGRVWFVGQKSDYIGVLNPEDGTFERFDLRKGAGPHNCIVDEDGFVWYTGNTAAHIGRLDPLTGVIQEFPMPDPAARDPHTLIFDSVGDIWFTVQGGNYIGKLTTATKNVELVKVPTPNARPYGIVIDENDRPWVVEFGSFKIATVDPVTMELTEIELPRTEARPRRLGITSDQVLWYVDYSGGFLGSYDPSTSLFEEWAMPSGKGAKPYGVAVDDRDRIWFVETGQYPNQLVGFDPMSQQFVSTDQIESGGRSVRHMYFDSSKREIWFGADSNTIGRAKLNDTGL